YQQVFREGSVQDYELEIRRHDGRLTPVVYNASLYRDESDAVAGVFAAARDITERKRAEHERGKAEELRGYLAAIVDSTEDAVIGKSLDGMILSWNTGAEKLYGYSAADATGKSISLLCPPGRAAEAFAILEKVGRGEIVEHHETERIRKDGTRVQLSLTVSPIRDPQGRITGASTIARDISYRKRAEEELRRSVAYNRSLIEASLDPLVTISPEGKITDVNRATENITGCGREQLIGSDFCDYFTDPEKARIGYQQVFREGSVQDYELEIRCGSGKTKPVLYNASVYRDETGEIGGIFAAARDITARKRAEQALEEKARDLARSNADLEQFAYVASHDLQEPLRMVANFTQLLAERYRTQLGAEGAEFVAYAVDGATRMQTLIQDLLMYSRVGTRGKSFEPTDCNEILGQAVANLQVAIRETGALVSHSELPVIRADASQFLQLLQNLIGNAIKFRGESTPQVHVSAGRQGVFWQFSVRDNGIGIDPRFADRIFVIFQRLHSRGEYPGTGIGLALCKKIVERHGGRIWVESEPGKGSTFNFTLLAP
ncbi:MAG TPA: PAS domain S-box protein, partial [Bryobacteraceae bacterium]|nr:PAS domain S-box protein [Bryobacteraceae bacterium]